MKIKVKEYDFILILSLFPILLIDMLNGIMLENNFILPISISQIYKLIILLLMLVRLVFTPKHFIIVNIFFLMLLFPTLVRILKDNFDLSYLFNDIIKISKYITPFITFLVFKNLFRHPNSFLIQKVFKWIYFSCFILLFNILIKIFGLGYPMYEYGNIGSRGFFFAGNEISALLLILTSIISFDFYHLKKEKKKYILFNLLNIYAGILLSSKTAIIGTFLIFIITPLLGEKIKFNKKNFKLLLWTTLFIIPIVIYFIYRMVKSSDVMQRFEHFWEKLDFWTFILSNRNNFFKKMIRIYENEFTWWEKIIGGGQSYYESLNNQIIEIDFVDIYFAYGIIGVILFLFTISYVYFQSKILIKNIVFKYSKLTSFILILMTTLSFFSGHVFNSGVAGIYIGFAFALMYYKINITSNEVR